MEIKCNLKWLIAKSGLTQVEVAVKMGVTPQQLNSWVSMKKFPRIDKAMELCRIIGCTLNDLYEEIGTSGISKKAKK
ncbi:MAG: helix-turn-helix domain-containing protein [Bacillaceae bacterium]|nr:helix-turn-helix domain-containing protein [Bacillaceae bacterium]